MPAKRKITNSSVQEILPANYPTEFDIELLVMTRDDEIIGIRVFHEPPARFNSYAEMKEYIEERSLNANELKESIDNGYCDMLDLRIVRNKNAQMSTEEFKKLKKIRDASIIYDHITMERKICDYNPKLLQALEEPGQNTKELISVLQHIKANMRRFTALMLKKQSKFVYAVIKILEYLHFSQNLITPQVYETIYVLVIDVLRFFKIEIFGIPNHINFHDEFGIIMNNFNAAIKKLDNEERINLHTEDDLTPNGKTLFTQRN